MHTLIFLGGAAVGLVVGIVVGVLLACIVMAKHEENERLLRDRVDSDGG
jgi:uncharacterized membrane-anchored protein YhcB (DUF1043 family)